MRGLSGRLALMIASPLAITGCAVRPADIRLDREALDRDIRAILEAHGAPVEAGVWFGGVGEEPWYARDEHRAQGGASAVKTAYLVELFAEHAGRLDEPLGGVDAILADAAHPAIVHFDPAVQDEIRREHAGASVRRVGQMMIRGDGVSNAVYNAAANVTTAVLGGPEGITGRIHARSPEFEGIVIRRHMLADRNAPGDNEATAASLAGVLRHIARGDLRGVDAETTEAIRAVLLAGRQWWYGRHFFKSGSLDTDPLVRVLSGYFEKRGRVAVYAVMLEQPGPGPLPRAEAGQRLEQTARQIRAALLRHARRPLHGALGFSRW